MKQTIIAGITIAALVIFGTCSLFIKPNQLVTVSFKEPIIAIGEGEQQTLELVVEPASSASAVEISYSLEDDTILDMYSVGNVSLITGLKRGLTRLTAKVGNSQDVAIINVQGAEDAGYVVANPYITCSTAIANVQVAKSIMISADLIGGTPEDARSIVWTRQDATMLDILGNGDLVLVTPRRAGVTSITLSHSKAAKSYTINFNIAEQYAGITLSKNYLIMDLDIGYGLSAYVEGATASDYQLLTWNEDVVAGESNKLQIIGTGQSINIIAVAAGRTRITARMPTGIRATCDILVSPGKVISLGSEYLTLNPNQSPITIDYEVTPSDANIMFTTTNASVANISVDTTNHTLTIIPIGEGTATIKAKFADAPIEDTMGVIVKYDRYLRSLISLANTFNIPPTGPSTIVYEVSPPGAIVYSRSSNTTIATSSVNMASRTVTISPKRDGDVSIEIYSPDVDSVLQANYAYGYNGITIKTDPPTVSGQIHIMQQAPYGLSAQPVAIKIGVAEVGAILDDYSLTWTQTMVKNFWGYYPEDVEGFAINEDVSSPANVSFVWDSHGGASGQSASSEYYGYVNVYMRYREVDYTFTLQIYLDRPYIAPPPTPSPTPNPSPSP